MIEIGFLSFYLGTGFSLFCTRFIDGVNVISIHFQANSARAQIKKLVSRVFSVSRCSLGSGVFCFSSGFVNVPVRITLLASTPNCVTVRGDFTTCKIQQEHVFNCTSNSIFLRVGELPKSGLRLGKD